MSKKITTQLPYDSYFDVSVSIRFNPQRPPTNTEERIAIEEMQTELNVLSDKFAEEISKKINKMKDNFYE
jgi:hypothetical protein